MNVDWQVSFNCWAAGAILFLFSKSNDFSSWLDVLIGVVGGAIMILGGCCILMYCWRSWRNDR